jgi:hypothetical protein
MGSKAPAWEREQATRKEPTPSLAEATTAGTLPATTIRRKTSDRKRLAFLMDLLLVHASLQPTDIGLSPLALTLLA